MVMLQPFKASGGITAFTREPSLRRASTMGELSSIRLPIGATIRSIAPITAWSVLNAISAFVRRPLRST